MAWNGYPEATRDLLARHGGLWFNDESFIIQRNRSLSASGLDGGQLIVGS